MASHQRVTACENNFKIVFQIDARSNATGDVIFKDNMTGAVAGLVDADYRLPSVIICCRQCVLI